MHPNGRPDDLDPLEVALLDAIGALPVPDQPIHDPSLPVATADEVFTAQVRSRHLDHAARWLRSRGAGFYTIGSAGHESNALVAAALRPTDPALLH